MSEITVVVPTRNRVRLLAQTLHTVLAQNVDLEVVVVDEVSSDETATWLAAHPNPRVRTIRDERPRGLPAARNVVISTRWLRQVLEVTP